MTEFQDDAVIRFDDEDEFLNHLTGIFGLTDWQKIPVDQFCLLDEGGWLSLCYPDGVFPGIKWFYETGKLV